MAADDLWPLHLNAKMLLYKVNCGEYGQKGVPLAASGAADFAYGAQGLCRHQVGQGKGLLRQRRGF